MHGGHWPDDMVVLAVLWRLWRMLYSFTYEIQTSQTDWPLYLLFSMTVSYTSGKAVFNCADHLPRGRNYPVLGNRLHCEDTHQKVCIFSWPSSTSTMSV